MTLLGASALFALAAAAAAAGRRHPRLYLVSAALSVGGVAVALA